MRAREIMTRDPFTVRTSATLQEALDLMVRHDIHCLPVVDDQLEGIITDRDLKMMLGPGAQSLADDELDDSLLQSDVARAMTVEVITVHPDTPVSRLARRLADLRVGDLPVVDDHGELVGVVSITDVLVAASRLFEREE